MAGGGLEGRDGVSDADGVSTNHEREGVGVARNTIARWRIRRDRFHGPASSPP